jgi:hypothetical protein
MAIFLGEGKKDNNKCEGNTGGGSKKQGGLFGGTREVRSVLSG